MAQHVFGFLQLFDLLLFVEKLDFSFLELRLDCALSIFVLLDEHLLFLLGLFLFLNFLFLVLGLHFKRFRLEFEAVDFASLTHDILANFLEYLF
jgi:hypothetical protein